MPSLRCYHDLTLTDATPRRIQPDPTSVPSASRGENPMSLHHQGRRVHRSPRSRVRGMSSVEPVARPPASPDRRSGTSATAPLLETWRAPAPADPCDGTWPHGCMPADNRSRIYHHARAYYSISNCPIVQLIRTRPTSALNLHNQHRRTVCALLVNLFGDVIAEDVLLDLTGGGGGHFVDDL